MAKRGKGNTDEIKDSPDLKGGKLTATSTSLAPLQIIRTETVISRLPIHNLVKGGAINIQISRKNDKGKVTLHWEVSPSSRFGHPGQLAYKLDTIVINRIIDEVGRPVPKMIKIGTLNQLCQELGSQKGELKRALQQNAATTISAKFDYKGKDGLERKLEAIFARYSVVFTGETLPNGEKADEIFVIFNDPYLEVLNSAPVRPLNYDYLRGLSPTCQRFYEIISYRMYAAVKYNHPTAKLLYSDYCTYSAQRRHYDFERVRVQMYRVHKPHLESDYIAKVAYQESLDGEGKPDWIIYYTPGAKAKTEYDSFNRKHLNEGKEPLTEEIAEEAESQTTNQSAPARAVFGPKQKANEASNKKAPEKLQSLQAAPLLIVQYFHQLARGKAAYQPGPNSKELSQAEAILATHGSEKVKYIIEFAVKEARQTNFQMRTFGAIFQYVDEGAQSYEKWQSEQGQPARLTGEKAEQAQQELDEYQRAEEQLASLSQEQFQALYESVKQALLLSHREIVRRFDEATLESTIRAGMIRRLIENDLVFLIESNSAG